MEWAGLETVADLLGYEDMEMLVTQLQTIREFQGRSAG